MMILNLESDDESNDNNRCKNANMTCLSFAGIFPDSALPSPHTSSSTLNLWSIGSYNYYISPSSFTITFFFISVTTF